MSGLVEMGIPIHSTKGSLILDGGDWRHPPFLESGPKTILQQDIGLRIVFGLVSLSTPPSASFGGTPEALLAPGSELH